MNGAAISCVIIFAGDAIVALSRNDIEALALVGADLTCPSQPAPIVNLLRPAAIPLRELRHRSARNQALHHDARLNVIRLAPSLLATGVKLDPPR